MRTSSAARPPRTKKTNVETMYRMPIFLWSVVVNQAPTPRRSRAARECAGAGVTGRATTGRGAVVAISLFYNSCCLPPYRPRGASTLGYIAASDSGDNAADAVRAGASEEKSFQGLEVSDDLGRFVV